MRRVIVTAGPSVRELEEQFFFILCDAHSGSTVRRFQCYTSTQRQSHTLFFSLLVCILWKESSRPYSRWLWTCGAVPHERLSDLFSCIYMCNFFLCWALSLSTLSYIILLTSTPPAHPLTWPVSPLTNTHGHKTPSAKPTVNEIWDNHLQSTGWIQYLRLVYTNLIFIGKHHQQQTVESEFYRKYRHIKRFSYK